MSDTGEGTEIEPSAQADAGGGTAVAVAERPGALAVPVVTEAQKRVELRKDRILLPFLLPVGAILAVALFAINLSRIFLAASQDGSTPAVVAAVLVTFGILAGATTIAAIPKLRTSSLVLTVCGLAALVLMSGSIVLGAAENKEVKSAEPVGDAINTLTVQGFPEFRFQAKNFDVPAGINQIKYVSEGGAHTLVFAEPEFSYMLLSVPGGADASKVELVAGKTYTIYCTIPGHREAGMEATITVGKAGGTPEAGTGTPTTTLPGASTTTTPSGQSEVDPSAQSGNETGN